jgi:hypothetical protein
MDLLAAGWSPLPLPAGQKTYPPTGYTGADGKIASGPKVEEWSQAPEYANGNTAVRLPSGVIGLDVDQYVKNGKQKNGYQTWQRLCQEHGEPPQTWVVTAREDGLSGIRLYRLPAGVDQADLGGGFGNIEVIRFGLRYILAPGSVNPDAGGAVYKCYREDTGEIVDLPHVGDLPVLPRAWFDAFCASVSAIYSSPASGTTSGTTPTSGDMSDVLTAGSPCQAMLTALSKGLADLATAGSRHDSATRSVFALVRLGEQGHSGALRAISEFRSSVIAAFGDSRTTAEGLEEFRRMVDGAVAKVRANPTDLLDKNCCGTPALPQDWTDPLPMTAGCAIPFPVDALPKEMAAAVDEVSRAVLVDPAIPAVAFLGVLSGLVGAQTTVVIHDAWSEPANLYLAVVAETGAGKTPGTKPAWEVLNSIQDFEVKMADQEKSQANALLPIVKTSLKNLQKDVNQNANGQPTAAQRSALISLTDQVRDLTDKARRDRRLRADDVTPEQMAVMMSQNNERLILVSDEGSVFHHMLGMYSSNPNVDLFLKSWDRTEYSTNRKGGGGSEKTDIILGRPTLTVAAFVQPTTIARFAEKRHEYLSERGVLGRVLFAWPQDRTGTRIMSSKNPGAYHHVGIWGEEVRRRYFDGPQTLVMSNEARDTFIQWHNEIERGLTLPQVYGDVRSFAIKYRASVARIAGLFARMDGNALVEDTHVQRAIRLGEYFIAHAQAVVESWVVTEIGKARKLLGRLKPGEFVSVRDAGRASRLNAKDIVAALEVLDMHGYVRPSDPEVGYGTPGRSVGKASPIFEVNPRWAG